MRKIGSLLLIVALALVSELMQEAQGDSEYEDIHVGGNRECKPIPFEACKDVGYNMTAIPNLVGLEIESEARYSLGTFKPLVKFGCSSQLQFLLCAFYAPMCTPQVPTLIGPCRPLCEAVRDRCAPVLRGFGFPWPSALNCSILSPTNNERHMCMEGPGETVPLPSVPPPPPPSHAPSPCAHLAQPQLYGYLNASGRCAPLCAANIAFSAEDKAFAGVWMAIWAVATFVVGIFTLSSLLLDSSLFRYPDRAAAHICLCYSLVAAGYLVRLVAGRRSITCRKDPDLGISINITEGALVTPCVVVFLLLYYFSLAAGMWWVIHSACWFLRAWRRVSHEEFLLQSSWLHAIGWGAPSIVTIACLVLRKVEADELTGTCFAGGSSPSSFIRWVIVPQFLFLVMGASFVILCFACFWRNRSSLAKQDLHHAHIDVSAARVGVMSVLYMVPATCLLGSSFYEMTRRDSWQQELRVRPSVEVFMLKIFMSLAPGLLLGLFLINDRVLEAWTRCWKRLVASRAPPPAYFRGPTLVRISKDVHTEGIDVQFSQQTPTVRGCPAHNLKREGASYKKPKTMRGPETPI